MIWFDLISVSLCRLWADACYFQFFSGSDWLNETRAASLYHEAVEKCRKRFASVYRLKVYTLHTNWDVATLYHCNFYWFCSVCKLLSCCSYQKAYRRLLSCVIVRYFDLIVCRSHTKWVQWKLGSITWVHFEMSKLAFGQILYTPCLKKPDTLLCLITRPKIEQYQCYLT